MKIPKDVIKEYVKSENFTNTTDIMESIKSMFADVLNEVLQCELDEQLGYNKHERTKSGEEKKNYRNGSTKRKMKTQLGEVEISVPRDRNGEYEPKIISKAAYVVLGVNADGYKDILGIWVGGNESSKFWLGVLNELKSRGVKAVDLFCVDGLSCFREAINAVYPFAGIQRCIIHQIRSSSKYDIVNNSWHIFLKHSHTYAVISKES